MRTFTKVATTISATAAMSLGMSVFMSPAAQAHDGTPCDSSADACLDLSAGNAWLMRDGRVVFGPVPMSSGKDGQETPTGTFEVTYKDRDHYSQEYDAPMPYSVFFTDNGHAIHEGNINEESNGCVRLTHEPAQEFFSELEPGEVLQIAA